LFLQIVQNNSRPRLNFPSYAGTPENFKTMLFALMYTSPYYIKLKAISPQTQWRRVQDYFTYNIIYVTVGLFFKLFQAWSSHIIISHTEMLEQDSVSLHRVRKGTRSYSLSRCSWNTGYSFGIF